MQVFKKHRPKVDKKKKKKDQIVNGTLKIVIGEIR